MGNYENLKKPLVVSEGWDYICFTDNPLLESDIWDMRICLPEYALEKDPKRKAMIHMIEYYKLFDEVYDNIISLPAGTLIRSDLNKFMNEINLGEHDMAILNHPWRNCLYKEAEEVANTHLDHASVINKQVMKYKKDKYPSNNGLWATGIVVRNNQSANLKKACEIWATEYKQGSRRDQVSINYSFWKAAKQGHEVKTKLLPWAYTNSQYFIFDKHLNYKGRTVS